MDLKIFDYSEDSEFLVRASENFNFREVDFKTYIYYRDVVDSITKTFIPEI